MFYLEGFIYLWMFASFLTGKLFGFCDNFIIGKNANPIHIFGLEANGYREDGWVFIRARAGHATVMVHANSNIGTQTNKQLDKLYLLKFYVGRVHFGCGTVCTGQVITLDWTHGSLFSETEVWANLWNWKKTNEKKNIEISFAQNNGYPNEEKKYIQIFIQFYVRSCLRVSPAPSNQSFMKSFMYWWEKLKPRKKETVAWNPNFFPLLCLQISYTNWTVRHSLTLLRLLLLIHLFYSLVVNNILYFHLVSRLEFGYFQDTFSKHIGHALLFETSRDHHKFYE